MRHTVPSVVTIVVALASAPVLAQTTAKRNSEEIRAAYEQHKAEFDYLLGDWEFSAESREYGKFRGFWSAVRLATGQILDEYRIVGDTGETIYATSSVRNYNGAADRWELVGLDGGNGIQDIGTARRVGDEMQIEQRFGVITSTPSVWKIRYYDIQPDRFSWSADRSTDGGKTWVAKHQTIEARRIGPARLMGPLAGAKPSAASAEPAPQSTASPASGGDPISGNWGPEEGTLLELKFDGTRAVTGTVIWRDPSAGSSRAPIKSGTFDPRTGALTLEGDGPRPDTGAAAHYVIKGTLSNGTLTGTFTFADHTGEFAFTRK